MNAPLAPPQAPALTTTVHALIARDLDSVEKVFRHTLEGSQPGIEHLLEHLANYRGKRLRPTLLLLVAGACGEIVPAHHVLGAVVEMVHTATLVHDDVLDRAVMRRYLPTINAGWGNQTSILLGDYLFTHAFHLCSTLDDARACRIIGEATNKVCAGELHQICRRGDLHLSEEEYFAIIDAKTAELTSCCCRLGAMYSGMTDDVVESLARFGRWLGMAFQIADDVLDLVGDERATGKSLGTDLEQQKMTLPLIRLLDKSSPEEARRIRDILTAAGNHKREALAPALAASGAIAYARRRAEDFAARAAAELDCLCPSQYRSILETMTDRVVHRET